MPTNQNPNLEDTARIDLRQLEASADEADRRLLLLSISAAELPRGDDPPSTPPAAGR